jgi:hypothetical protein
VVFKADSDWLVTVDDKVHALGAPCVFCRGQTGTRTGFLSKFFAFPVSVSFHSSSVFTRFVCG